MPCSVGGHYHEAVGLSKGRWDQGLSTRGKCRGSRQDAQRGGRGITHAVAYGGGGGEGIWRKGGRAGLGSRGGEESAYRVETEGKVQETNRDPLSEAKDNDGGSWTGLVLHPS